MYMCEMLGGEKVHNFESIEALMCPLCGENLAFVGNSLVCGGLRRHNFDFAKSGYVNLNTHAPTSGDDKEMAKARKAFLRKGYYEPLAKEIATACGNGETLCDAGCGEGYYTEIAAKNFSAVIGVDLSKYAIELAAKNARQSGISERILYTVSSVYSLPLKDSSCDTVVNVFAPCVETEYSRVLKSGGKLIIAAAGRDHLKGLKETLYDTVIPNEERRDYPLKMRLAKTVSVKYDVEIFGEDIYSLFTMTPYFYRTKKESVEKLKTMERLSTLLDFEVRVYEKNDV